MCVWKWGGGGGVRTVYQIIFHRYLAGYSTALIMLYVCLSISLSLFQYLSIHRSALMTIRQFIFLSIYQFVCLAIFLSCMSIHLSINQSMYSTCLFVRKASLPPPLTFFIILYFNCPQLLSLFHLFFRSIFSLSSMPGSNIASQYRAIAMRYYPETL